VGELGHQKFFEMIMMPQMKISMKYLFTLRESLLLFLPILLFLEETSVYAMIMYP